ncbi:MAG: hypothetical protein IKT58_02535 [Oscillospiraceae bacterium]|nr:hypothetical protein [Oscillospiraceae bacterium]
MKHGLTNLITDLLMKKAKESKKGEEGEVYLSPLIAVLGIVTFIPFAILAILAFCKKEALFICLAACILPSLGLSMIIGYINCRIRYNEEGFAARNFLGIRRRFTYDQITGIRRNSHETYLYVGKHRYMIDEIAIGGNDFLSYARDRYRMATGKPVPNIRPSEKDLFRGNIKTPGLFVGVYMVVFLMILGMTIFFACSTMLPSSPENTEEQTVSFVSCELREDRLCLNSGDGKLYMISFVDEVFDSASICRVCYEGKNLTVYSDKLRDRDCWEIKAIYQGETEILSFEETTRLHRQEYWPLILLVGSFCLLWLAYVIASIVVGRNIHKYSRKTVKKFFGEEYVNWCK